MNRPFPKPLFTHAALTDAERSSLSEIDEEELSASAYIGLLVLVEGVLCERVPGFHCQYTPGRSTAEAEGVALSRHLLHLDNGFDAEQIEKGRKWLAYPGPSLTNLLKFFFKLRTDVRAHHLAVAKQNVIDRFHLTPSN